MRPCSILSVAMMFIACIGVLYGTGDPQVYALCAVAYAVLATANSCGKKGGD